MTGPALKLGPEHDVRSFHCGVAALDDYLTRFALANQQAEVSQTYVILDGATRVAGYYTLAVGGVEHARASPRVLRGVPRHPIPVMLLARLAVDRSMQGRGLGRALLRDALIRTARAAEIAGIRALLVHAKDERARSWYERFDFEPGPTDPLHLFLLMKDLKAALRRQVGTPGYRP